MKPLHARLAGSGWIAVFRAVVLISVLAGCSPFAPSTTTAPPAKILATPATPATSATSSPSSSPIDTTNWTPYTSKRYGFKLKYPPGWIVKPAKHDWTLKADANQLDSGAQDGFVAPNGDLYVAVWATPAKDTPQTLAGVGAWAEQYCQQAGSPCPGIQDRAVPLCNERWDCHPGLLVPFGDQEFRAFFIDADHGGQIVGVDIGRPEWHKSLVKFGGARRFLEGLLSTMDVCPARPDQTPSGCP